MSHYLGLDREELREALAERGAQVALLRAALVEVGHWANGACPLFDDGALANEALRLSETPVTEGPDCFYCHGNGVQPNGVECPLGCSAPNQGCSKDG
jgi:hypothetical protein